MYRSGGGRFTAALPAAEETIHRSASNGLRRSASTASFRAGTLTPSPYIGANHNQHEMRDADFSALGPNLRI